MKCYLAHPVTDYGGTERQRKAIAVIENRGWEVENPDQKIHQDCYARHGFNHFLEVVQSCDLLAFVRFPGGSIGAGVAKEIAEALRIGLRVYDITSGEIIYIGLMMPYPVMTVEQTRELIAALRGASVTRPHEKSGGAEHPSQESRSPAHE
jgi:hypothetical protein